MLKTDSDYVGEMLTVCDYVSVTAYVKDGAFPALYDTATVMLNVLDENDNAPVFKNHFYHLSVPENANMSVIHTIMASDADTGRYGHITYSIVGESLYHDM